MSPKDKPQFAAALAGAYSLYERELSDAVLQMWWEAMADVDVDSFRRALTRHAMNPDRGQYCPKPADVMRELQGTTGDTAQLAWAEVARAVKSVGSWDSVVFDDAVINTVISDMGGWPWLCARDERELPFVEKRFRDAYQALSKRGDAPKIDHLPGRIELDNVSRGFSAAPPRRIGSAQKAITAQPVGAKFAVETRGVELGKRKRESGNTIAIGDGCFRRVPTMED